MAILIFVILLFLSLFTVKKVYDKYWSHKLGVSVNFKDRWVFEGDRAILIEVITNRKPLPIPALEIDFNMNKNFRFVDSSNSAISDKLYRRDIFAMGGNQKITRTLQLDCLRRGFYVLDRTGVSANDLFLKNKYVISLPQNTAIYVYPARVPSEKIAIPFNRIMGEALSRDRIYDDPFEFGGIRNYMISDPMKYINWKASARCGDLVVNLHDSTLSPKIRIILDTYDDTTGIDMELNEESIRVAAALAERLTASGIHLAISGNGRDIISGEALDIDELKSGAADIIRQKLARLVWKDEEEILSVLSGIKPVEKTLNVLISKNRKSDYSQCLRKLSAKCGSVWIMPYKNEKPELDFDTSGISMVYWAADERRE